MSAQHGIHPNEKSPSDRNAILDPDRHRPRGYPVWTTIAVIVVIGIAISIGLGLLQRIGGLGRLTEAIGLDQSEQTIILVESRNDLIVMSVNRAGRQEVRVMNAKNRLVEDVSRGALHAGQPALSYSGKLVAYFVMRDDRLDLNVAEIGGNSNTLIPSSQLLILAKQKNLEGLEVCPWSPISWSKKDRYIAFFVCDDEDSLVAVKDRNTNDLFVLDSAQSANGGTRTLVWLSDTELAVVQSEGRFDTVWLIDVVSGQRQQVFGP